MAQERKEPKTNEAPLNKKKILMIDDDEELVKEAAEILTHAGYLVDSSPDGLKGLELAVSGGYDLILLDVKMPGLSGREVLKRLKEKNTPSKVIVVSGSLAVNPDSDRAISAPSEECEFLRSADDFIEKPFSPDIFLAKIELLLLK